MPNLACVQQCMQDNFGWTNHEHRLSSALSFGTGMKFSRELSSLLS
jgi:hypothetical protein